MLVLFLFEKNKQAIQLWPYTLTWTNFVPRIDKILPRKFRQMAGLISLIVVLLKDELAELANFHLIKLFRRSKINYLRIKVNLRLCIVPLNLKTNLLKMF